MEDPTSRYTTPDPRPQPPTTAAAPPGRRPDAHPAPPPGRRRPLRPPPPPPARLAPAAGRSRPQRLAGLRRDRPARRAVVLCQPDARPGPARHRVEPALAAPPDRRSVRGSCSARRGGTARAMAEPTHRGDLEPGRRIGDRPGLAGRLAPPGRRPLCRGPRDGRLGSGDRAGPLARRPRAALPRAPAIAGPRSPPATPSRRAISTTTRASASR